MRFRFDRRWILAGLGVFLAVASRASADEWKIDLAAENAAADWKFLQPTARIEKGELVLDGRKEL